MWFSLQDQPTLAESGGEALWISHIHWGGARMAELLISTPILLCQPKCLCSHPRNQTEELLPAGKKYICRLFFWLGSDPWPGSAHNCTNTYAGSREGARWEMEKAAGSGEGWGQAGSSSIAAECVTRALQCWCHQRGWPLQRGHGKESCNSWVSALGSRDCWQQKVGHAVWRLMQELLFPTALRFVVILKREP